MEKVILVVQSEIQVLMDLTVNFLWIGTEEFSYYFFLLFLLHTVVQF